MSWCSRCAEFHTGICPQDAEFFGKDIVVEGPATNFVETVCLGCLEKDKRISELEKAVGTIEKRRKWNRDYQRRRRAAQA